MAEDEEEKADHKVHLGFPHLYALGKQSRGNN